MLTVRWLVALTDAGQDDGRLRLTERKTSGDQTSRKLAMPLDLLSTDSALPGLASLFSLSLVPLRIYMNARINRIHDVQECTSM